MKPCIVTLASIERIQELVQLIDNLNACFVDCNPTTDLIVFHELKDSDISNRITHYKGGQIVFHAINNFDLSKIPQYQAIETPERYCGFTIGYRQMCRFFAGTIFKIFRDTNSDYTHYLRLDTDSRFLKPVPDIFKDFRERPELKYGYVTIINEPDKFAIDLKKSVIEYFDVNEITYSNIPNFNYCFAFYNNFEIVNLKAFTNNKYLDLFDYLDKKKNGFLKYRWGDHILRFMFVQMTMNTEKEVKFFSDIHYFHNWNFHNSPIRLIEWNH